MKKEKKAMKVKTGIKAGGIGGVMNALGAIGTARSVWQGLGGGRKPLPGMPTQYY